MNIDNIVYGNPRNNHLVYLKETAYADKFYDQFVRFSPPPNTSKGTKEELNELVTNMNALAQQPELLQKFRQYDYNLYRYFEAVFKEQGFDEGSTLVMDDILADINPLIYKLKYHFNRPRPHQLARAFSLSLWPHKSYSDDCPSFPSAHTVAAHVICHVFGNYYPKTYHYLDELAQDIETSRLYMGLNYQSDIDQALFIVEAIKSDKEFNNKYHL